MLFCRYHRLQSFCALCLSVFLCYSMFFVLCCALLVFCLVPRICNECTCAFSFAAAAALMAASTIDANYKLDTSNWRYIMNESHVKAHVKHALVFCPVWWPFAPLALQCGHVLPERLPESTSQSCADPKLRIALENWHAKKTTESKARQFKVSRMQLTALSENTRNFEMGKVHKCNFNSVIHWLHKLPTN